MIFTKVIGRRRLHYNQFTYVSVSIHLGLRHLVVYPRPCEDDGGAFGDKALCTHLLSWFVLTNI